MKPDNDHTCNAWCAEPIHAHLVLVDPACQSTDEVLARIANPYRFLWHRRILSARPAPEADKAAVVASKVGTLGVSTHYRTMFFPSAHLNTMNVWLIHYQDQEEEFRADAT